MASRVTIRLKRHFELEYDRFPAEYKPFLVRSNSWLEEQAGVLVTLLAENDTRDLFSLLSQYLFVYAIPSVEAIESRLLDNASWGLVKAQFWTVVQARFLDDILDNDNSGQGFENSAILSHYCMERAFAEIRASRLEGDLSPESFWPYLQQLVTFQVEMTRPFAKIPLQRFLERHWQRGATLFWLPERLVLPARVSRAQTISFLKAYFDLVVGMGDIADFLSDTSHRLNTIAVLAFEDAPGNTGLLKRWEISSAWCLRWLADRKNTCSQWAGTKGMVCTGVIVEALWDRFVMMNGVRG